ncbi:MAG: TolC family protein, partial [Candidatus Riflebacteria bacterium]|nr:TolC family protein [Candidatus Riflebacteria bacterium]
MSHRFFHKEYALISLIALNSLCCYAQEPEITSSPRYADRNVINRILVKDRLETNKSTKINITNTQEGPITQPDEPRGKTYKSTSFGACDIFEKDEHASFTISLKNAVEMSLKNNIALNIEKIDPEIYATSVEQAKAEFDTNISASISASDRRSRSINANDVIGRNSNNGTTASIEAEKKSTSGIKTNVSASINRSRTTSHSSLYAARLGIDVTAPLMRGAGKEVNLVSLRKAELDLDWSKYELYGYILDFVSETEKKYWQYYLNVEQLEIVKESLQLALQQRDETQKRIEVGKIAESEIAAADAEVALCQEDLIDAESRVVSSAISLLRNINHDTENFWRKRPNVISMPKLREIDQYDFNLEDCIADALIMRPELRQAELMQRKNELEIVSTKNGMLPKLDFFISLGKTGYSKSFDGSEPSFNHKEPFDSSVGLTYDLNRHRRGEKAKYDRAKLNLKLQKESIKNLEQLVKEDVIKAYIEIKRTKEQLAATTATAQKQEEKLRVEKVKFDVGKT